MRLKAEKGTDEFISKIDFMNVQPAAPKSISLLKIQKLENVIIISRANEANIEEISTTFEKCHLCLNMDYILSLTREIIDISIIFKTFTRKWNFKYRVKEYIKATVVERMDFAFKES